MGLNSYVKTIRWGEKSIVSLYLSLISGMVVALQYDVAEPAYSVHAIDIIVPFGLFWRALHFYSSQLFFLFSAIHLYVIYTDDTIPISFGKWVLLIASLPLTILLLFTGYVLRGDATGQAAGLIAENIALSLPVAGEWVNGVLFSIAENGMRRIFANHVVSLGLLWLVFCWDHIRRFRVGFRDNGMLISVTILLSILLGPPLEPERLGMMHVSGPWFFIGLQELLRYLQPFWAGIVFPATFLVCLCLSRAKDAWRERCNLVCGSWLALYAILTLIGFSRGG